MNRPGGALLAPLLALAAACSNPSTTPPGPDADDTDLDAGPSCTDCVTPLPLWGSCAPLVFTAATGALAWSDARCSRRDTLLSGSVARHFTYTPAPSRPPLTSSGVPSYDGIGYVVSHTDPVLFSDGATGTVDVLLSGPHHLIRRITWTVPGSTLGVAGTIRLVVDWFVATGRSHPVYAITYDLTGIAANALSGDSRAPYGEIRFDGDRGGVVDGVGWGDAYRFVTLSAPLDKLNGWDYSEPNVVPYALEWITDDASGSDAEMGLVQTEPQARRAAGGYWFYGSWGTRDTNGPMPDDYNWPFQLNQYSFASGQTTDSTRLSWGLNYGAVGRTAYAELGADPDNPPAGSPSGYPYQSYSTAIVLGRHSDAAVLGAAAAIEVATTRTTVTAATGSVVTTGPAGVGRPADAASTQTYDPPGYDPRYAVWRLEADPTTGVLDATFTVTGDQPLTSPTLAIRGATATATVRLAGQPTTDGSDVYRSFDPATDTLWLTFPSAWRGDIALRVEP